MNRRELLKAGLALPLVGVLKAETRPGTRKASAEEVRRFEDHMQYVFDRREVRIGMPLADGRWLVTYSDGVTEIRGNQKN